MRASDDDQEIRDLNLVLYRQLLGEINRQVSEAPKEDDWNPQFRESFFHEVENGPGYKQRREIIRADSQHEKTKAKKAYQKTLSNHYRDYYSHTQPSVKWSETAHMLVPDGTVQWPREIVDRQFVSKANHLPVQIEARSNLVPGIGNLIESRGVIFGQTHSIEHLNNLPLHCIENGFLAVRKMIAGEEIDIERLNKSTKPNWKEWPDTVKQSIELSQQKSKTTQCKANPKR